MRTALVVRILCVRRGGGVFRSCNLSTFPDKKPKRDGGRKRRPLQLVFRRGGGTLNPVEVNNRSAKGGGREKKVSSLKRRARGKTEGKRKKIC